MKLLDNINKTAVPFECDGVTWYMKKLTLTEVKKLQAEFKKLDDNPEDLSPLMILFTDVLVGEDGKQFEEVEAGISFEQLCDLLPIQTLSNLADAITKQLVPDAGN